MKPNVYRPVALRAARTLASFAKCLETGVSTLELDLQITKDGREATYVGNYVKDLTFEQVRSLDCGSLTQPQFPGQTASPGAKMPPWPTFLSSPKPTAPAR